MPHRAHVALSIERQARGRAALDLANEYRLLFALGVVYRYAPAIRRHRDVHEVAHPCRIDRGSCTLARHHFHAYLSRWSALRVQQRAARGKPGQQHIVDNGNARTRELETIEVEGSREQGAGKAVQQVSFRIAQW